MSLVSRVYDDCNGWMFMVGLTFSFVPLNCDLNALPLLSVPPGFLPVCYPLLSAPYQVASKRNE